MVTGLHTSANQRRSDPIRIPIELGEGDDFIVFDDRTAIRKIKGAIF
jgi:hypothetical protein